MRVWTRLEGFTVEVARFPPTREMPCGMSITRKAADLSDWLLFDLVENFPKTSLGRTIADTEVGLEPTGELAVGRIICMETHWLGAMHWFFSEMQVVVDQGLPLVRGTYPPSSRAKNFLAMALSKPIPGKLLLSDEEMEVYRLLGQPPPILWIGDEPFFQWAKDRPDAELLSGPDWKEVVEGRG